MINWKTKRKLKTNRRQRHSAKKHNTAILSILKSSHLEIQKQAKRKETVLFSNWKMKQTKMTQQRLTGFYKTPKPCAQPKSGSQLNHPSNSTSKHHKLTQPRKQSKGRKLCPKHKPISQLFTLKYPSNILFVPIR